MIGATSGRTTSRPNILFVLDDQHRGDGLGIEGHPVLQTPHLDFLAASGGRFRRAYSEAPTCIPARRTLMSGQAPAVQGMVGMQDGVPWEPRYTLAGELTRAGYQTEMIGKLHLWPRRKRFGFEHVQLADSTRASENDYLDWLAAQGGQGGAFPTDRWAMAHGATPNGWIGRPSHLPETLTHAFWCVSRAIEFLAKRDPAVPFFLNVSFIDPHPPLTPPPYLFDRYAGKALPRPVVGDWAPRVDAPLYGQNPEGPDPRVRFRLDEESMHYCRAGYYGLINHVDMQIGRLVQYLRDARLLEQTFILFTSDHGEMLGDHHMFRKGSPFEGAARVPFIVRAPKTMEVPPGAISTAPVGLQDVLPTLLDVAGVALPETVTGRSVLPLLRSGPGAEAEWRDVLHLEHAPQHPEHSAHESFHALVDRRFKYVWFAKTGRELLFDLHCDPHELHDLLGASDAETRAGPWRQRLVQQLRGRPEGFVTADRLVAGRPHHNLVSDQPAS